MTRKDKQEQVAALLLAVWEECAFETILWLLTKAKNAWSG